MTGLERINGDYATHRAAARQVAKNHFDSNQVLPGFLQAAMD